MVGGGRMWVAFGGGGGAGRRVRCVPSRPPRVRCMRAACPGAKRERGGRGRSDPGREVALDNTEKAKGTRGAGGGHAAHSHLANLRHLQLRIVQDEHHPLPLRLHGSLLLILLRRLKPADPHACPAGGLLPCRSSSASSLLRCCGLFEVQQRCSRTLLRAHWPNQSPGAGSAALCCARRVCVCVRVGPEGGAGCVAARSCMLGWSRHVLVSGKQEE